MNAYWLEFLHTLRRPVIEDGKRKIYNTTYIVIHPLHLSEGDIIGAGDGWLNITSSGNRIQSKLQNGDYIDTIYFGSLTKADIEKRQEKETETYIEKRYYRNDPSKSKKDNQCEIIYRNYYVDEEWGNRLRHIQFEINQNSPDFWWIAENVSKDFPGRIVSQSTLTELEHKIISECTHALHKPVKGSLKACHKNGNVYFEMDDEFFVSLETLV